jgi:hypothetical protein
VFVHSLPGGMVDAAAARDNEGGASPMRNLLLNLFGTVLLAVVVVRPGQGLLSRRLAASRTWLSHTNTSPRQ